MASKARTRAKFGGGGRTVVATFPLERLRALLSHLPAGDDRTTLEAALAEADVRQGVHRAEERLNRLLSIESLIPFGWMLAGDHSPLAYGAVREGDFRRNADGSWSFGPTGAFDREDAGVEVLRDACQGGVMSEEHGVHRLLEPTLDRGGAVAAALRLEVDWRLALPAKLAKPKALLDGGVYGREAKGMHRTDWHGYMTDEDLAGLPEGACIARPRGRYQPGADWRVDDVVHRSESGVVVASFRCDAALRPVRVYVDRGPLSGYTDDHRWMPGARDHDPRYDGSRPTYADGPYDCVLGSVWATTHNGQLTWNEAAKLRQLATGPNCTNVDRRDNVVFPMASKEEADAVATNYAVALGLTGGDVRPMPPVIAAPDFGSADALAEAA